MGGYSHLFPSGQFLRFILVGFCVHVYNTVFVARDASPRRSLLALPAFYLSCRGARPRNVT